LYSSAGAPSLRQRRQRCYNRRAREVAVPATLWLDNNGLRLAAHLYRPARTPAPGVVICHGFGSRKEKHADLAALLAERGYVVLVPDLRGHGASEGQLDGGELGDLLCALATLAEQPEVEPRSIAVRGSSMGGRLALEAAARDARVRAVVAVCAADPQMFRRRLADPDWVGAARAAGVRLDPHALQACLADADLGAVVQRLAGRALLFVHAEGDEIVPVRLTRRLYELAAKPKRLLVLPGGDHGTAQHDHTAHAATIAWLDEHLRCPA
jgi:dipeptidyl aminopeptidase/acylaminoacyl peptidase